MQNPDTVNAEKLSRLLGEANAPDLVVWYIDMPDVAGHIRNFYPHSQSYLNAIHLTDQWIGKVLAAIRNRKNFVDEDWLIAITADHGGYHGSHGLKGGHNTDYSCFQEFTDDRNVAWTPRQCRSSGHNACPLRREYG